MRRIDLRKPSISKIGRKIKGLIKACDNCGAKHKELFKMYTFSKSDQEKVKNYCRQCYVRMLRKPVDQF